MELESFFDALQELGIGFELIYEGGDDAECGFGYMVFHTFDIGVDSLFVDTEETKKFGEGGVALDDGIGDLTAFISEDGATVFLVVDEAFGIESAQHIGDTGLRNTEVF